MKTSNVLASLFLSSMALAAPLNKRDYVTKTEVVVETVVVFTTVYDGDVPVAEATSTPGLFYEQPHHHHKPASSHVEATSTSATSIYTPPVEQPKYTPPPVQAPSPKPSPSSTSVYTPPPPPPPPPSSSPAPSPTPVSVYTPPPPPPPAYTPPPAPASSAPASPAPSAPSSPSGGSPSGGSPKHGDITVYDTYNAAGGCGPTLSDNDITVAVSVQGWGADVWVDNLNTNPWCGKKVSITYKGKTITAKVMDKCVGCKPNDVDLTRAAWKALTGEDSTERYQADWVVLS